jgi:hypothetical protein
MDVSRLVIAQLFGKISFHFLSISKLFFMKKISIFVLLVAIFGGVVYFSGVNLSFLGLRSAILSAENCDSSLLLSNKAEYTKSVADLAIINNYITLNSCQENGQNIGKNQFEIAACQRKFTLRNNKKSFVDGYLACQASVDAGPQILSGTVTNSTLLEQSEGEDMHYNESVYTLQMKAQGESYVRELVYELTLPLENNEVGVIVSKADLTSSKTGTYACAQTLITCRSVDGGYQVGLNGNTATFATKLNLSVTSISRTGTGTLKFLSGKYSVVATAWEEKPFTKISNTIAPGNISYTMAFVDTRDLTAEIIAQENTSSPTIPVQVSFNKLIHIPSISFSSTDFVISNNANPSNYKCINTPDNDGGMHTICSFDLTPKNQLIAADITVDFPAGAAQDKTRPTPKTNSAAARKTIHYVYGAPTIFVGAPCGEGEVSCSGIDNTPQLIARAAVGDIPANTSIKLYRNPTCDVTDLIQSLTTTRNMTKVDLYENQSLDKNESRIYSVKVGNNCSSGRTSASGKQAEYRYTGETYAQVDRFSCMNPLTIPPTKIPVSPYLRNAIPLCDTIDRVDPKKCNAWQGNATFNPECFPTGQGTIQNPYRVCTAEQLQEIDNAPVMKHYRLGWSIDLANSASWFGGQWFNPIGRTAYYWFSGSLDGNGFEIQNLTIKNSKDYIGLFSAASGASYAGVWIHDLKLSNVLIENPGNISGSLTWWLGCAVVNGLEITNTNMQGVKNSSGGIAGYTNYESKILYSKVQGSISTADDLTPISAIGGIVGITPGGPLELAHSESDVAINAKAANIWGLLWHGYGWNTPATNLSIHDNVVKGSITAREGSYAIGGMLWNSTYVHAENNVTDAGNNQITIEGDGTVGYVGWFVGLSSSSDYIHNSTTYSIQWNTAGYIGGFGGSIGGWLASKNSASGAIGWDNSTWPRSFAIGGFVGSAAYGKFFDNYSTSEISLSQDSAAAYVGWFAGIVGGAELRRNYATGSVFVNHVGDYFVGGFAGPSDTYGSTPYALTDNFSTGRYIDTVGIGGVSPDYYGGFVATTAKTASDVFENNFFYNATVNTCTGKVAPVKPACTSVASKSVFYTPTQGVYTRADNSWDFVNTWREVAGGLPVLR